MLLAYPALSLVCFMFHFVRRTNKTLLCLRSQVGFWHEPARKERNVFMASNYCTFLFYFFYVTFLTSFTVSPFIETRRSLNESTIACTPPSNTALGKKSSFLLPKKNNASCTNRTQIYQRTFLAPVSPSGAKQTAAVGVKKRELETIK